jgi:hypothetical protein
MTNTLRKTLLASAAALLLTTGAALAVPATAQSDLNVRSGPGPQYPVVGALQGGETVDVGGCTGSWCQVSFSGGTGYANRSYLAMGGEAAPGPAVAAVPYGYDDYDNGYYDDGYAYGPGVGFFIGADGRRHQRGWNGRTGWNGGNNGWNGGRGNWAGRPGGNPGMTPGMVGPQQGFAGPPTGWQRPGTGIGAGGTFRGGGFNGGFAGARGGGFTGAPAGMRTGGGGAPAGGGAQGGFAGSITHGR